MPLSMRRGATLGAVALTTLGLAATAGASLQQLPPGAQVNDDLAAGIDPARDAGASDVVGGSLAAGGIRVPWAAFEQQTSGKQQIFVRAFKNGVWKTQGQSLNIERDQEAEAPSIDFAGTGRTVPWTAWYEPNSHLGDKTNIFASRFAAAQNTWIPEGQDRAPNNKVPSLNIHTNQEAENPALAGGAATAGNDPVPWVAWQEKDGGDPDHAIDQIFVSRGIKQTDCSANLPGGGTSVSAFCWQQVGNGRLKADALEPGPDPTLNVDPTRNGIEPDIAFTGPNDTVPWVTWYEVDDSKITGLHNNDMVFAAKAVNDGGGNFHWVVVGNRLSATLDNSGNNKFGGAAENATAEGDASLNANPDKGAEDPRVAAGTLTPGGATTPWIAWAEELSNGHKGIFVSRLVGGTHFELANGGKPVSNPDVDAEDPDITFSGNTPYVTWHSNDKTVVGHFADLTTFKVDNVTPEQTGGRSPISSSNTSDPFTADGQTPPVGTVGTPFFLTLTGDPAPHKLLAHAYQVDAVRTHVASHVKPTTARLNGSVDRGGAPVKVHFEFGLTKAYGSRTDDQQLAPGNAPIAFSAPISGLHPRTRYHYRSVAVTDFGVVFGPDQEFKTKGLPYPHIVQKRLWMTASGNVLVRLSCTTGQRCTGTVRLVAKHRTLGHKHYSIRAHHTKLVKVHLKPKAQELVRNSHKLPVKVTTGGTHRTLVMRWTR